MPAPTKRLAPLRDVGILVIIAVASVIALKPEQLAYIFVSPWTGFGTVLLQTGWAALKVWAFWTLAAAVLAGTLLRIEPELGLLDAATAGFVGVWIFAYVAGNALGPIGLLRSWTIWTLLAVGGFWLWRSPPTIELHPPSPGQKLMLLAFALAAPGVLVLQLGSPVPPFMDVLATPAAAQRILTFGRYLPFDSDPYGYWDPSSQLPGLELFYAVLGLGSHTSLALLADTAAIVPMAGLLILTTYRLGKTIAGDLVGGMASLLLFATVLIRVLPYMHGRSNAFVLVGAGLAFFLDERRNATRTTLGALALGTAVASHAINGALGMLVAGFTVLFWLLSGEVAGALAGFGVLAGASMIAFPTVAVALRIELPYPVLPLTQLLGLLLVVVSARWLAARTMRDRTKWLRWALTLLAMYVLLWHPPPWMSNNHHGRFPLLVYGGGLGLALMLWYDGMTLRRWRAPVGGATPSHLLLGPVTMALLICISIEYLSDQYWLRFADPSIQTALHDWYYKIDYWHPYVLVLPTAYLAAWLYRKSAPRPAVFLVLTLLFFPWRAKYAYPEPGLADPNCHQHSITEGWSYQLETGKTGYWGNTADRRWAQTPAELELAEVLRGEVAAGRITPATHIVHLAGGIYLYKDNLLFSVYTGINDDAYLTKHEFDASIAGSRLRPIQQVAARLAERPPYIVIHTKDDASPENVDPTPFAGDLAGYTEIFNRGGVRLLREDSVAR